jgi:carboxylesterase type B
MLQVMGKPLGHYTRCECYLFVLKRHSPFCPQPSLPTVSWWDEPVGAGESTLTEPLPPDEFNCLNLNITVPREALTIPDTSKLAVLVFIHGGAYVGGSQSLQVSGRELFDGENLVRKSLLHKQDLVVVTMNYRVGPLGFLASRELEDFNRSNKEAVGNYGLHDQRQALEWIHKYISGFGGDPDNVTIHGTSAGGSSCHFQCIFPNRKFRRAILSSGTLFGIGALRQDQHQTRFDEYKEKLMPRHRDHSSSSDMISFLQTVPEQELVTALPVTMFTPLIDHDWVPSNLFETVKHIQDPPDIMVGCCAFEVCNLLLFFDCSASQNCN